MAKVFTVDDGKLVLALRPAENGWYAVSSPVDPRLHTQAKSLEEAFVMARDAFKLLRRPEATPDNQGQENGPTEIRPHKSRPRPMIGMKTKD